jgi:lipopolysaccharide transport system ATP-binding protein
MQKVVFAVENVSKKYRLGALGSGTLREDIQLWLEKFRSPGKITANKRDFYALRDISFALNQGDSLGLIGRNGAGKSTLLKILTRITRPSSGCVKSRGKVSALLEIGTGFHPELTGRENIFMNGAFLGMRKREIQRKFDEIVAFSELDAAFIDTPVKRYSSGMYVRLAFSVAAHLNADILILDEVLAVGDLAFREKSMRKMKDIIKNQGKTVVLVSHMIDQIREVCSNSILLDHGTIYSSGTTDTVTREYSRLLGQK